MDRTVGIGQLIGISADGRVLYPQAHVQAHAFAEAHGGKVCRVIIGFLARVIDVGDVCGQMRPAHDKVVEGVDEISVEVADIDDAHRVGA